MKAVNYPQMYVLHSDTKPERLHGFVESSITERAIASIGKALYHQKTKAGTPDTVAALEVDEVFAKMVAGNVITETTYRIMREEISKLSMSGGPIGKSILSSVLEATPEVLEDCHPSLLTEELRQVASKVRYHQNEIAKYEQQLRDQCLDNVRSATFEAFESVMEFLPEDFLKTLK